MVASPKRNRKQRSSTDVYRIEHLFTGRKPALDEDNKYYIEGDLDGILIVSCPEGTPTRVMMQVQEQCAQKFKQDVLAITHNISLVKATKVSKKEGAKIIKMAQDVPEDEEPRILT